MLHMLLCGLLLTAPIPQTENSPGFIGWNDPSDEVICIHEIHSTILKVFTIMKKTPHIEYDFLLKII